MATVDTTARVVLRPGHLPDTSIHVDGQELKGVTRAVTIRGAVGTFPTIELELYAETIDVDFQGRVELADTTRKLLVGMGWTPPPDETGGQ